MIQAGKACPCPWTPEEQKFAELLSVSFSIPFERARDWLLRAGYEQAATIWREDEILAGLLKIPMGQFFGGRSVSMSGLTGVCVEPSHRSQGQGRTLLQSVLKELRRSSVALSTLYASALPFYRQAGYERAGTRTRLVVSPSDCSTGNEDGLEISSLVPEDPRIAQSYSDYAALRSGWLDRGEYCWGRIRKPPLLEPARFVGIGSGMYIEGYLAVCIRKDEHPTRSVGVLTDFVPSTSRGLSGLCRYIREQLGEEVSSLEIATAYPSTLLVNLKEKPTQIIHHDVWMTRIVHLQEALESRGYPKSLEGQVDFEVEDDLLGENSGRWSLKVRSGRGQVIAGGNGDFRLTIRALSPLYTGFLSASELVELDWLKTSRSPDFLDLLFGGRSPSLYDTF